MALREYLPEAGKRILLWSGNPANHLQSPTRRILRSPRMPDFRTGPISFTRLPWAVPEFRNSSTPPPSLRNSRVKSEAPARIHSTDLISATWISLSSRHSPFIVNPRWNFVWRPSTSPTRQTLPTPTTLYKLRQTPITLTRYKTATSVRSLLLTPTTTRDFSNSHLNISSKRLEEASKSERPGNPGARVSVNKN